MKYVLPLLIAASMSFAQWGGWGGGGGKSINDYKKISVSGREVYVYAVRFPEVCRFAFECVLIWLMSIRFLES